MDLRVGPRFPGLTINGTQAFLGIAYSSARKISASTYIDSKQVLCSLAQLRTAGSSTNAYSPDTAASYCLFFGTGNFHSK